MEDKHPKLKSTEINSIVDCLRYIQLVLKVDTAVVQVH